VVATLRNQFGGHIQKKGGRKIDFIQHRNNFEVVFHRHVQHGERLSLNSL
jgi:hypothetical protein